MGFTRGNRLMVFTRVICSACGDTADVWGATVGLDARVTQERHLCCYYRPCLLPGGGIHHLWLKPDRQRSELLQTGIV